MLKLGRYILTLKTWIEALSYASTGYVVASYGPCVKIWATFENFLGKRFTARPGRKSPVRLWSWTNVTNRTPWRIERKGYKEKHAVGLLLQKTLKRRKQDAKATTRQTAAQTLNEELKDSSSVQSYHVRCEPALTGLNAGCPLSSWTAWPLASWTA